jgi:hypothetical protein
MVTMLCGLGPWWTWRGRLREAIDWLERTKPRAVGLTTVEQLQLTWW